MERSSSLDMGENWLLSVEGMYLAGYVNDSSIKVPLRFCLSEAQFLAHTLKRLGVKATLVNKMHIDMEISQYQMIALRSVLN